MARWEDNAAGGKVLRRKEARAIGVAADHVLPREGSATAKNTI